MEPISLIQENFRLVDSQKKALTKLGILTVEDLLFYFPVRYAESLEAKNIASLSAGDKVVIFGRITKLKMMKGWKSKIPMAKAQLEDATGKIDLVWFHQPYIAKMIKEGSTIEISGKVSESKGKLSIINADTNIGRKIKGDNSYSLFEVGTKDSNAPLSPVYSESRGITSRWMSYTIKKIFAQRVHEQIKEVIPKEILKKYNLPSLSSSLFWIHSPKNVKDAQAARKRFAFEEIFFIQLERQLARKKYQNNPSFKVNYTKKTLDDFLGRFPFKLTSGQNTSIRDILDDFDKELPMSRLLEGDVGSGKTAVAAATAYVTVMSKPKGQDFGNLQTAIMAPTEILAKQHFDSFIEYFEHLPIQIGLITSSGCKKFPSKVNPKESTSISRAQLLKWVKNGEIPILIGTHSLIQKSVDFKHLAYVIIDEQHRFGTKQRYDLTQKTSGENTVGYAPHLLSMTATPIPRTLALTIYGDLDISLIDTMPKGRKPTITELVTESNLKNAYERVESELKKGRQAYVICPRIEEPDLTKRMVLNVKSVKVEAKRLKKDIFPKYEIDILHSKMRPKEKEEVMKRFSDGDIDILVSTSVVEVGVNVPNATTIIIEGTERFGLAQLHQLRGRVLRSTKQSYCFLVSGSKSKKTQERIKVLITAKNGFELAEKDLELRGAGELSGKKQWGISDLGMEAIKNLKMVEAARKEAQKLLSHDLELKKYPLIKTRIENIKNKIHFE